MSSPIGSSLYSSVAISRALRRSYQSTRTILYVDSTNKLCREKKSRPKVIKSRFGHAIGGTSKKPECRTCTSYTRKCRGTARPIGLRAIRLDSKRRGHRLGRAVGC